jgi:hypothetical protein
MTSLAHSVTMVGYGCRLILLSQKVAADGPENQVIEEIQDLARGRAR